MTINAKAGLQYDVVRFEAKPASKVELKLVNNDDMAHNLVLTKPGQREAVANAALALGTEDAKNWVPDLASSPVFHAGAEAGFESRTEICCPEIARRLSVRLHICHGLLMYGAMYIGVPMPPLEKDGTCRKRRGRKTES